MRFSTQRRTKKNPEVRAKTQSTKPQAHQEAGVLGVPGAQERPAGVGRWAASQTQRALCEMLGNLAFFSNIQ